MVGGVVIGVSLKHGVPHNQPNTANTVGLINHERYTDLCAYLVLRNFDICVLSE